MTAALQDRVENAPPLEFPPLEFDADHSSAYRRSLAVRDIMTAMRLWRLCVTLAWLDIRLRYRGSVLGPFWLTLSTALMIGSMGVIYATLFNMDVKEYMSFLALSLVLWGFMNTMVTEACTAYTSVESNSRSIRMPYSLYAASNVVRNLVVLAHNLVVVVAVYLVLWTLPGWDALLALPGLLIWLVDGFAVGLLLGSLCARFRDIPPIIGSLMQMAFFISAVIWKPSQLAAHEWMLAFNPLFALLEIVRAPLLGELPTRAVYLSALLTSVLLCAVSWWVFVRVRGRIAFWV
jgi:lipopolysaccharide transport system permease protein